MVIIREALVKGGSGVPGAGGVQVVYTLAWYFLQISEIDFIAWIDG